jgi:hypothetical protein
VIAGMKLFTTDGWREVAVTLIEDGDVTFTFEDDDDTFTIENRMVIASMY